MTMTRRTFLNASVTGSLSLALSGCDTTANVANRRKPNLLFIWTDEQRADTLAVYGNRKIHAPNLNKFAADCTVFENAFVTQPVCTPSRSSVMTGLWPHTSGLIANNIPLAKNIPCFPELLNDPAYHTAYMGKWHLGDEIFLQHGFHEWASIEDTYSQYYSQGRDQSLRSDYHHFLVAHGQQPGADGKFRREFAARMPIELCKPKFLELQACDFLRRHRADPFILYVNYLEPHPPYYGPLDDEHDRALIDIPRSFSVLMGANDPKSYRQRQERYRAKNCKDEQSVREVTAKYWGNVTQVDRSVGAILKTLDDLGLADNTLVVYTSDHGDMMGAHCLMAKGVMYQEAVRVPWLMRIPVTMGGGHTQGRVISQQVSHIDLIPTLLDLMGSRAVAGLPGQSLVPLIQGGALQEDHVIIEWNTTHSGKKAKDDKTKKGKKIGKLVKESGGGEDDSTGGPRFRTIIAPDGWKLNLCDTDHSQLFNLTEDPDEIHNLFGLAEYKDLVRRLTDKIHRWQEKTGDRVKV